MATAHPVSNIGHITSTSGTDTTAIGFRPELGWDQSALLSVADINSNTLSGEAAMKNTIAIAILATAFAVGNASAQTTTPRIDKKEANQQTRIGQGVRSGELTPRETRKLERQQIKIRRDEAKAKSDGVVTPHERAKLNRELNRASKNIYAKKHNNRVR
jgi:hypothetical protein